MTPDTSLSTQGLEYKITIRMEAVSPGLRVRAWSLLMLAAEGKDCCNVLFGEEATGNDGWRML